MIVDVIDLDFELLNFTKKYDTARMARGKSIYRGQQVKIEKVEKKETEENEILVTAKVRGNSLEYYNVTLKIEKNTIKQSSCTCPDYQSGNICKHILATSLEIIEPHEASTENGKKRLKEREKEEIEEARRKFREQLEKERKQREYYFTYSNAIKSIERFKQKKQEIPTSIKLNTKADIIKLYEETQEEKQMQNNDIPELATQMKIEPRIEIARDKSIHATFKIGRDKMYIIKDIQEFYNSFKNKETVQYGKKLRFIAQKESFTEESQDLLNIILEYGKILSYNQEIYQNYYYGYMRASTKTMYVIDEKVEDIFEATKNIPITVNSNNISNSEYKMTDKDIKITLKVSQNDKTKEYKMKINIEEYEFIETNKNIYLFYNNEIYKIDKSKNKNLVQILEMFKNNKQMLIPEDKIEEFKNYVIPEIIEYIPNENLPKEVVKEAILVHKLASKIYLDLDEKDNITLELKFCYLNYEFNILDSNYKNYVEENKIIRNIIEERKVLKKLFLDGFELATNKKYFVLKDQDATYEFLSEKIVKYMNDFEVLATDKFKNKKVKSPKISNVSVKLESGLLELDISKINMNIDEIKDILKNYNIKKKYYKLKNGDYLKLEKNEDIEFLNDIQNTLDINYEKIENGIIKVPANRSIYLEKLLDKNKTIASSKNDDYTKLINNIENKNFSEDIKLDKEYEKILRDYQKTGYKWLKVLENYKLGGILADDMGLGKTLQLIALIASGIKKKKSKPSIVVCPSSLVLNWKAETEKWAPKMKVLAIKGDLQTRKNAISEYADYDLIITSYDSLKRDIFEYENKQFKYIIADEAQYIKNFTTQNATALKNLMGETKFALTGTPIENSISELWSIFDFIMPGYLYNYNKFKKKFEIPILKDEDNQAMEKLKMMINPFILRRVKSDVLTELPEKNITVMNSEMTDEQQKIYLSYFAQTKKEVAEELNENGFEKSKFKILMLLTRLRQICCHPSLFIDNYTGESGKLNQCMDIINEAINSGHKILLFSGYTSMFNIIEEKLQQENINYYKLTGSTPVSQRVQMVEEFNNDKNIKIFLISLKAGGTGLNLTGADVVIHYDPWWNVSSENQATDRAYRIGQKNSVQVYKLITTNSIEEKINKLQEKKAKISEQILSKEEKFINKLSKEEIMQLFE